MGEAVKFMLLTRPSDDPLLEGDPALGWRDLRSSL
jgi:hypothetical protein